MKPLASKPGPGGTTTAGNWVALQTILTQMTDEGQSLGSFLETVASADATLVFCGHSLGGGLTPLVAASLYPTGTASSGWANVYTYGSAGPATADATFATAWRVPSSRRCSRSRSRHRTSAQPRRLRSSNASRPKGSDRHQQRGRRAGPTGVRRHRASS